ncbi:hypothetical protein FRC07_000284 [Ceratobasidium sp. 392]|nr:hypothetical protein FRC07_000284 [Ceratobasidium sp. 392]
MDMDHEIALMYASTPFGLFQPRMTPYSPFENVVLRVVRPRPRIEDLVLQLLGGIDNEPEEQSIQDSQEQGEPAVPIDSTPDFDISERMAREMQAEEDREQELRDRIEALSRQMGEFMSSMFSGFVGGNSGSSPVFRRQHVNAEAGPSTVNSKPSFPSANQATMSSSTHLSAMVENDQVVLDELSKSAGKQRARQFPIYNLASSSNSMDLLESVEAALKHEVNKFDFPERLDFLNDTGSLSDASLSTMSPIPTLAHTANNGPVHAHERALLDLLANLDAVANDQEEEVRLRQLNLVERIKREMEVLDKKVLELWAAGRKYTHRMEVDE